MSEPSSNGHMALKGLLATWAAPVIVAVMGWFIVQSWSEVKSTLKEMSSQLGTISTDMAVTKQRIKTVERAVGIRPDWQQ